MNGEHTNSNVMPGQPQGNLKDKKRMMQGALH